jgi:uncharacterized protein (TIGR02246 family)
LEVRVIAAIFALAATNDILIIMRTITIIILFLILYSCGIDSNDTSVKYNSADDSLALVKMVNEREIAMKKKDIRTVIAQFSEDATFINGGGYYCANKTEIEAFHKGLTQSDSVGYYYTAGQVHVRILDNKNALVYYPNRMDWFKISNPKDTIEKETRLLTLTAQKRNNHWQWVAITNQQTPEYFDDLTKHKINDLNEYFKDSTSK